MTLGLFRGGLVALSAFSVVMQAFVLPLTVVTLAVVGWRARPRASA